MSAIFGEIARQRAEAEAMIDRVIVAGDADPADAGTVVSAITFLAVHGDYDFGRFERDVATAQQLKHWKSRHDAATAKLKTLNEEDGKLRQEVNVAARTANIVPQLRRLQQLENEIRGANNELDGVQKKAKQAWIDSPRALAALKAAGVDLRF